MYRLSFPKCTVEGSLEPVRFAHLVLVGAVPKKCGDCKNLFEGSCLRGAYEVGGYLNLDYGSCPVQGDTHPVDLVAGNYNQTYFVPAKCNTCEYLIFNKVSGFVCYYEKAKWGDFPRNLDWGNWTPKHVPINIDGIVASTDNIIDLLLQNKKTEAVNELKRLYPSLPSEKTSELVDRISEKVHI